MAILTLRCRDVFTLAIYSCPMQEPPSSSILHQNPGRTVFLVDIPTSIALGQELSPLQQSQGPVQQRFSSNLDSITGNKPKQIPANDDVAGGLWKNGERKKQLLSSPPLESPFPVSTEPKSDVARERVLRQISAPEKHYRYLIEGLVLEGLREISEGQRGKGRCLPRRVVSQGGLPPLSYRKRGREARGEKVSTEPTKFPCSFVAEMPHGIPGPPVILSSTSQNIFEDISELRHGVVKNPSNLEAALIVPCCKSNAENEKHAQSIDESHCTFNVPPKSNFLLGTLPLGQQLQNAKLSSTSPIPGMPRDKRFNLILLDPPWPNRSVRRSRHYQTHSYADMDVLTQYLCDVLCAHLHCPRDIPGAYTNTTEAGTQNSQRTIGAIWVTNSEKSRNVAYEALRGAGLSICEEWIWIKTTINGEPITPLNGLWRKPYEILVIGERTLHSFRGTPASAGPTTGGDGGPKADDSITRRVIAAVPDIHSRKPNLREIFEKIFFIPDSSSGAASEPGMYSSLEVFARNLTAGWWACGDEVLKFNSTEWWAD